MPPPPPSPLLLRGSLNHPVRGGTHHLQNTRSLSFARQPAAKSPPLSRQLTATLLPLAHQTAPTTTLLPLSHQTTPTALPHPPTLSLSRSLSTTPPALSGDSHGPHYDTPQGWLFGIPPGQKYEKEGWENMWVYGFWGSLAFGVVGYAYKPDTSIQTWALEEARRRLEIEGILEDPYPVLSSSESSSSAAEGEVEAEVEKGSQRGV